MTRPRSTMPLLHPIPSAPFFSSMEVLLLSHASALGAPSLSMAPRNSSRARPIFFLPGRRFPLLLARQPWRAAPGSELLPCLAVGRPCHYLAPSSRSELHRRPAQQAARCNSSHEIPSMSPASTRSAQRWLSTAAAPCCTVDLRGLTFSASRFAESAQRRRAIVGTRGETPLSCAFCVRLKGRTNESHNKLCNDCVCRLIAALVNVTPCASLVGKEPKTNGMHARHESARLFALYDCDLFYLRIRSMMCLRVYMRVKINCMNERVYRRK